MDINPIALRMAKTLWSFGHSVCHRVKHAETHHSTPAESDTLFTNSLILKGPETKIVEFANSVAPNIVGNPRVYHSVTYIFSIVVLTTLGYRGWDPD